MASPVVLMMLFLCNSIVWPRTLGATTIELASLSHPVAIGGILAITCEIRNMQEGYTVSFFREINGNTEQISTDQTYFPSMLWQRVFISKRVSSDGNTVYFMTLLDISHDDQGEYICSVSSMKNRRLVELATNSIPIEVLNFPKNAYPTCQSIPNSKQIYEGTQLRFICASEITNPIVNLHWSVTNDQDSYTSEDNNNGDTISSEITTIAARSHDGVTFVCTMTSFGFPERQRSCYIGPLSLVYNANENKIGRDNGLSDASTKDRDLSNGCEVSCPSEDTNTVIYLAAGTMGATILMFTFLITTIVLCCKYCKISGEVRAVQRSVPYDDGSEPVYVSLQRRPESDRSSMYMSVEDPNNPGNKVLMPRELVEEFYRSLSLKRKK